MARRLRVLLADDHTVVRAGLRALLEEIQDVDVVGEAADGREALERIETLRPDIAVLDITMPGLNGLEVAQRVPKLSPRTRVLVLSMHADDLHVAQALHAEVSGYLLKEAAASELHAAVHAVARGEAYLSPTISRSVVDAVMRGEEPPTDPLAGLTQRQREILQLVAEGKPTKVIAATLALSVKTIEAHRTNLMRRLGIHDIAGLTRFAVEAGLLPPKR